MFIQNCGTDAHSKIAFQLQQKKMLAKMDSENEEKPSFDDYLSKYIPIEILQETGPVETNMNIAWEHYCTCKKKKKSLQRCRIPREKILEEYANLTLFMAFRNQFLQTYYDNARQSIKIK